MATLNDIITDACYKNGLFAPGEIVDANYSQYAFREANRLLDRWNIRSTFIWTTVIATFPLTARPISTPDSTNQYWYTIGPAGSIPNPANPSAPADPDFIYPRPTVINRANLLIQSAFPNVRVPLAILTALQWSDETVPEIGTTPYPTAIYDDYANPFSRLYLWPQPNTAGNMLELFIPNQVARFQDNSDTFTFPPGYEDAFMLTLSEKLCAGVKTIPPELAVDAANARANVQSLNTKAPKISTIDSGMPGRRQGTSLGNFYDGWPTRLG